MKKYKVIIEVEADDLESALGYVYEMGYDMLEYGEMKSVKGKILNIEVEEVKK